MQKKQLTNPCHRQALQISFSARQYLHSRCHPVLSISIPGFSPLSPALNLKARPLPSPTSDSASVQKSRVHSPGSCALPPEVPDSDQPPIPTASVWSISQEQLCVESTPCLKSFIYLLPKHLRSEPYRACTWPYLSPEWAQRFPCVTGTPTTSLGVGVGEGGMTLICY